MGERKSTIKIICSWCGAFIREIDGGGIEGKSGGICPTCALKKWQELDEYIARQTEEAQRNQSVGIVFTQEQFRSFMALYEQALARDIPDDVPPDHSLDLDSAAPDDFEILTASIGRRPALHTRLILTGQRYVEYWLMEDLLALQEDVANEPEMQCRWN
jgi:hypothetical protein